jgi:hypothetical protein
MEVLFATKRDEQEIDPIVSLLKYEVFNNPIGHVGNCYYFISSLKKILKYGLIELWEGQRSLDMKRANEMAQYFYDEYIKNKCIKLRGSILLCKKDDLLFSNTFYLIDGQHRYFALRHLLTHNFIPDIDIRVDIIIVNNEDEIRHEFVNINKSVPVPVHYLTPNDIVNLCYSKLARDFPRAFVVGNCKRPSINADEFKDVFLKSDNPAKKEENILIKFKIDNADKLCNLILQLNKYYQNLGLEKLQDIIGRKNKSERQIVANCYEKCKKGDYLFLGLFKNTNWVTDLTNI